MYYSLYSISHPYLQVFWLPGNWIRLRGQAKRADVSKSSVVGVEDIAVHGELGKNGHLTISGLFIHSTSVCQHEEAVFTR